MIIFTSDAILHNSSTLDEEYNLSLKTSSLLKDIMFILMSANYYISIVKPTRCTNVSNLFNFGMTLYMFRTVFPSIIRSSRLYMQ